MSERAKPGRLPWWETVAIFVAIGCLWPAYILRWPHPGWRWLSYPMFVVMAVVAVRRMAAIRRAADAARDEAADKSDGGRTRLPWEEG
jgi:hypothetical protein